MKTEAGNTTNTDSELDTLLDGRKQAVDDHERRLDGLDYAIKEERTRAAEALYDYRRAPTTWREYRDAPELLAADARHWYDDVLENRFAATVICALEQMRIGPPDTTRQSLAQMASDAVGLSGLHEDEGQQRLDRWAVVFVPLAREVLRRGHPIIRGLTPENVQRLASGELPDGQALDAPYFGVCPDCRQLPNGLNHGKANYMLCMACGTRWMVGSNLLGPNTFGAEMAANGAVLKQCREVDDATWMWTAACAPREVSEESAYCDRGLPF